VIVAMSEKHLNGKWGKRDAQHIELAGPSPKAAIWYNVLATSFSKHPNMRSGQERKQT